jgi:hypothetical protein
MKFQLLLFSALTILAFSSCGKDETTDNASKIIGTWSITNVSCIDGTTSTTFFGTTTTYPFTATGKDYNYTTTFGEAPGLKYSTKGSYIGVSTATVNGQTVVQEQPINETIEGTYKIEGNILKSTNGTTQNNEGEIVKLTDEILELKVLVNSKSESGGVLLEAKGTYYFTYKKI